MAQDLRSFLDLLKRKRPDDLILVSREIDPAHEITALVVKLDRELGRRPVLLFERVRGTRFPVLTNLHASRSRLALAMNSAPAETLRTYLQALERPIAPRVVSGGPVKEVVLTGGQVDLGTLPQIVHHEGDAGVFLTAAISFARHPDGPIWNCAYNRLMLKGRDTTSIHLTLGKHLWEFQRAAEARNQPLPVAFAMSTPKSAKNSPSSAPVSSSRTTGSSGCLDVRMNRHQDWSLRLIRFASLTAVCNE